MYTHHQVYCRMPDIPSHCACISSVRGYPPYIHIPVLTICMGAWKEAAPPEGIRRAYLLTLPPTQRGTLPVLTSHADSSHALETASG